MEDGLKEEAGICYSPFGEDDLGLGVTSVWTRLLGFMAPHYLGVSLPRGRPGWGTGQGIYLASSKDDAAYVTKLSPLLGHSGMATLLLGMTTLFQLLKLQDF